MIEETSLQAYQEVMKTLGERQKEVYWMLCELGEATNTMLSRALHLPINCVTPRIFELRKKGLVIREKVDLCPITRRNCIFWKCLNELKGGENK